QFMDRIVSKMRVGHVPLNTLHRQYAPQRAAPAILDDVTDLAGSGGFAADAPGDLGVSGFEPLNRLDRSIDGRTFFIAGNQKTDAAAMVGMLRYKIFTGHDHGRQ